MISNFKEVTVQQCIAAIKQLSDSEKIEYIAEANTLLSSTTDLEERKILESIIQALN